MDNKYFLPGAVVAAGLFIAGAVVWNGSHPVTPTVTTPGQQQPAPTVTMDQIKGLFNSKNISFGNKESKLVFVEISDPSCPYCQVAGGKNPSLNKQIGQQFTMVADGGTYVAPVPEMKKLVDAGKASYVWVYANGHGSGEMGTKALYCAFEKGKFWEVSDLLMSEAGYNLLNGTVKNDKTKSGELSEFLKSAIGASDMKSCLDSGKYDSRIAEDTATSIKLGMNGTPKFFVNTETFNGAYSFTDMQATVEKYLK
ncbi:MAG: thioredoxin domain-containing protein [Candidatus Kaiserbacteria bacterium]|nr:thioredoxin domain-containing protein [Candidatus Kaiserbacteria bacterium]